MMSITHTPFLVTFWSTPGRWSEDGYLSRGPLGISKTEGSLSLQFSLRYSVITGNEVVSKLKAILKPISLSKTQLLSPKTFCYQKGLAA